MEADVHGKNITQGLDMSDTISSSPGALSLLMHQQEADNVTKPSGLES